MSYQEYQILSEFSWWEVHSWQSQWKKITLFTSSSYKPDINSRVFHFFSAPCFIFSALCYLCFWFLRVFWWVFFWFFGFLGFFFRERETSLVWNRLKSTWAIKHIITKIKLSNHPSRPEFNSIIQRSVSPSPNFKHQLSKAQWQLLQQLHWSDTQHSHQEYQIFAF